MFIPLFVYSGVQTSALVPDCHHFKAMEWLRMNANQGIFSSECDLKANILTQMQSRSLPMAKWLKSLRWSIFLLLSFLLALEKVRFLEVKLEVTTKLGKLCLLSQCSPLLDSLWRPVVCTPPPSLTNEMFDTTAHALCSGRFL